VLFCHITTHVKTDKYQTLLTEKGGRGFPHLVFMDAEGTVIAAHEGARSVEAFEASGKKAQTYLDLKRKADAGDKAAKADLVIADLDAGRLKSDEADKKLAGLGDLSADQKKALEAARSNADVRETYEKLRPTDPATAKQAQEALAKAFLERKKAGKPAPTGEQEFQIYWFTLLGHGEQEKDAALFEEAFLAIKGKFGKMPEAKQALARMQKTLDRLKKGGGDEKKDKDEDD
jgi:hypothetical protein